jgi:hypothetical protein
MATVRESQILQFRHEDRLTELSKLASDLETIPRIDGNIPS